MSPQDFAIAIMAAGKGTRLKSNRPKVLHTVGGKPLLEHVIVAATAVVAASDAFVIIGHEAELVRESVKHTGVKVVLQSQQRGTGHATKPLFAHIERLTTGNPHGEFYLTDIAALLVKDRQKVVALRAADDAEILGVNTRADLATLDARLRAAKAGELMAAGVTIFRPETVTVDSDVSVQPDTIIHPFVHITGKTTIGGECVINSFSVIRNCTIADKVEIR